MNYENIMVDLETLDTKPGAIILSLGACVFDDSGIGKTFYSVINLESCKSIGLTESQETLDWWAGQALTNTSAAKILCEATSPDTKSIGLVLQEFNAFISDNTQNPKIWGNGADFDNVILLEAYRRVEVKPSWGPYSNRCYRTLKSMLPGLKFSRTGTHHNALDDAITQAQHMTNTLHAYGIQISTIS